jgi:hypothetical protein
VLCAVRRCRLLSERLDEVRESSEVQRLTGPLFEERLLSRSDLLTQDDAVIGMRKEAVQILDPRTLERKRRDECVIAPAAVLRHVAL